MAKRAATTGSDQDTLRFKTLESRPMETSVAFASPSRVVSTFAARMTRSSELGSFKLPERSAFRVAAELSALVPKELEVTINDMEVTPSRARIESPSSL